MDISAEQYDALHDDQFEDGAFASDITAHLGNEPNHRAWAEFSRVLGPGSVLEIGPGTGHVLAAARAAGRVVAGVEASEMHQGFIRATWGIEEVVSTLDQLPRQRSYDNVIMVNVMEHVYDVVAMMRSLRSHLSPDARVFVSTVNADGIVGTLAGTYWSMFKPPDHVSFPSLASLARLATAAGYRLDRNWSSELPLETPIGLAVALRDFLKERRARGRVASAPQFTSALDSPVANDAGRARKQKLLSTLYGVSRYFDPTRHALAALHRAATVKGIFVPLA